MADPSESWQEHNLQNTPDASRAIISPGLGTLPDGEITQRWYGLRFQIQQWANWYIANSSNEIPISKTIQQATRDLGKASNPVLLLQAAVWHVLVQSLFPTKQHPVGMLWGGESVGKFKDLTSKAQLLSKTSIEANWRQHLSQLLVPVSPSSQEVDFAVGQLRQSLEAFLHPATLTKNDRELDTVFRDAISLQASLALQTAWWYCEYPGPQRNRPPRGITFDDATMTGQQRTARSHANRVTLTISPALIKRGDSRGDDFSSERMVCQSEVVRGHSTKYIHKHIASTLKFDVIGRLARRTVSACQPKRKSRKSSRTVLRHGSTGLIGGSESAHVKKKRTISWSW